ncbi:MAG: bifunctional UDP-N-acetylglucosamine diphosphorylase/glucosamine-1-phosphate N-acetyltransferase GlmU [Candidatus Eremiobacteraeota bacterium]|nr:bifunctional UDP-N-acetylglucosamine diphosphorylase/glucosamine-1-phosphate N-acetyltransferase GlmU [Candidatus Eremiobacteraeota bacterium]
MSGNGSAATSSSSIVLAAGKGVRMKSATPKVLHELCGRPMIWWVLNALRGAGVRDVIVVTSAENDAAVTAVAETLPGLEFDTAIQVEQLGTGHAAQLALRQLKRREGTILIAYGDMPVVDAALFRSVIAACDTLTAVALVTARMPLPSNFGRIVRDGEQVARIVEAKDCTPEELAINEMNAGIYAFDETALRGVIDHLRADNAQGEFYLTDTIAMLAGRGDRVVPVVSDDARTVLGVNDRVELSRARAAINERLCIEHMQAGVTIVDPASTWLEPELTIAPDVTIYPNTAIGGATTIGRGTRIGPNCRIYGATIGEGAQITESVVLDSTVGPHATVGPFAHLRDGAVLEPDVSIGNFVEVKDSRLHARVKARHLSYLGDAEIGEDSNVGAGTITCNYDGERKHKTKIGKNVKIGSDTMLVAPVEVGDGALTGAGSVVIRDVEPGDRVAGAPAKSIKKAAKPAR